MKLFSISEHLHKKRVKKHSVSKKPHTSRRAEYLLNDKTPFDVTEGFRNLKAALSVSVPKKSHGVSIMATSAYPEDGKTTVTVNLALMFAVSNAKVVLVDADIRKGRVAKYFKRKSAPGLSDCLSGQVTLDEVIHNSHINDNLSYITCGTHSPRPYELLESEEMRSLMEELKLRFDYVIIDTPPVLLISDALALAPMTDGAVLVCRHQVSFVSDISRALNQLKFAKANVLGVIVNDYKAPPRKKYGYGYGYKKYYYYSYGYTYGSTNPEDTDEGPIKPVVMASKPMAPIEKAAMKAVEEKPVVKTEAPKTVEKKPAEKVPEVKTEEKKDVAKKPATKTTTKIPTVKPVEKTEEIKTVEQTPVAEERATEAKPTVKKVVVKKVVKKVVKPSNDNQ